MTDPILITEDEMTITLRIAAKPYEAYDDCLAAAAEDVAAAHGLEDWDLNARWEDDERDYIWVDLPEWAVRIQDVVTALKDIADVHADSDDRGRIVGHAPPASDWQDIGPGSEWYEECDILLAEVRAALPSGWSAEWSDDDVMIYRNEEGV
jgi:hypothetical protein